MSGFPRQLIQDVLAANPKAQAAFMGALLVIGAAQYFLGPKQDWVESYRKRYWHKFHQFASIVGAYGVGVATEPQYAATIHLPEEEFEKYLWQMGYHRNALASYKYRLRGGKKEWSEGSWVKRPSLLADKQLHATLFDGKRGGSGTKTVDVYVHKEPSNILHPFKHLASNGMEFEVAIDEFLADLSTAGVVYDKRDDREE